MANVVVAVGSARLTIVRPMRLLWARFRSVRICVLIARGQTVFGQTVFVQTVFVQTVRVPTVRGPTVRGHAVSDRPGRVIRAVGRQRMAGAVPVGGHALLRKGGPSLCAMRWRN